MCRIKKRADLCCVRTIFRMPTFLAGSILWARASWQFRFSRRWRHVVCPDTWQSELAFHLTVKLKFNAILLLFGWNGLCLVFKVRQQIYENGQIIRVVIQHFPAFHKLSSFQVLAWSWRSCSSISSCLYSQDFNAQYDGTSILYKLCEIICWSVQRNFHILSTFQFLPPVGRYSFVTAQWFVPEPFFFGGLEFGFALDCTKRIMWPSMGTWLLHLVGWYRGYQEEWYVNLTWWSWKVPVVPWAIIDRYICTTSLLKSIIDRLAAGEATKIDYNVWNLLV